MPDDSIFEQFAKNLQDFLSLELDLGFTFVGVAKTEQEMGNAEHFEKCKRNALAAAESVHKFKSRLREDAREPILKRCAELEQLIATL